MKHRSLKWDLPIEMIVGRRALLEAIGPIYGLTSWRGLLLFCQRCGLPLRRTPSGKPAMFKHELVAWVNRIQQILREKEENGE